jgi:hypothetical protein
MHRNGHSGEYASCDWCGASIAFGNALLTLCCNLEQVDAAGGGAEATVTVIRSEVALTLCARCGNRVSLPSLRAILETGFTRT